MRIKRRGHGPAFMMARVQMSCEDVTTSKREDTVLNVVVLA